MIPVGILLSLITIVFAAKLPTEIKLCHKSDPNFLNCLAINVADAVKIFAKGNKELGIPQLEPFFIKKIVIDSDSTTRTSIQQKYENVYMHGSTNFNLTNLKFDIDTGCEWLFEERIPLLVMEADYEVKGQVLVFPLNSKGKCNITQYDLVSNHRMLCEKYTKNDEIYLRVTNYTMKIKTGDIKYYFENIFPGNEQISAEILKTLNENALAIFEDVKEGFQKVFATIYVNTGNKFFSKIPIKDIFLE